jgi:hypothetical protein
MLIEAHLLSQLGMQTQRKSEKYTIFIAKSATNAIHYSAEISRRSVRVPKLTKEHLPTFLLGASKMTLVTSHYPNDPYECQQGKFLNCPPY